MQKRSLLRIAASKIWRSTVIRWWALACTVVIASGIFRVVTTPDNPGARAWIESVEARRVAVADISVSGVPSKVFTVGNTDFVVPSAYRPSAASDGFGIDAAFPGLRARTGSDASASQVSLIFVPIPITLPLPSKRVADRMVMERRPALLVTKLPGFTEYAMDDRSLEDFILIGKESMPDAFVECFRAEPPEHETCKLVYRRGEFDIQVRFNRKILPELFEIKKESELMFETFARGR